jgi:hypothetical protein
MSDPCPDNSTSYLLHHLEDASNNFNWSSIIFAFTTAISVFAFAFAVLAVYQGILGAGSGQLECSKVAIGNWASKVQRMLSFCEMRYRLKTFTLYFYD